MPFDYIMGVGREPKTNVYPKTASVTIDIDRDSGTGPNYIQTAQTTLNINSPFRVFKITLITTPNGTGTASAVAVNPALKGFVGANLIYNKVLPDNTLNPYVSTEAKDWAGFSTSFETDLILMPSDSNLTLIYTADSFPSTENYKMTATLTINYIEM